LNGLLFFDWKTLPFLILALIISFTLHEFAHAWSAYKLGDPTAQRFGRVSLNPMVHLDLFGSIMMLLVGFGWAKPVPVDRSNFKNPRLMSIIVTAAGPFSNLLLAVLSLIVWDLFYYNHWFEHFSIGSADAISVFLNTMLGTNLMLLLFNLIPIPPLDGYRIIQDLVNLKYTEGLIKFERWANVILLFIVLVPPLRNVTLAPYFSLIHPIAGGLQKIILSLFGFHV